MKELIRKVGLFLAFCLFVCLSADMTATSVHLRWLGGYNYWVVFALFFVISLVASWSLTRVIKELKKENGSILSFLLALVAFLVFWLISFSTNVHYQVLQEHGHTNLCEQLADCNRYLSQGYDKNLDERIMRFRNEKDKKWNDFRKEVLNEGDKEQIGFGGVAETKFKELQTFLNEEAQKYNLNIEENYYEGDYQKIAKDNRGNTKRQELNDIINRSPKVYVDDVAKKIEGAIRKDYTNISEKDKAKYERKVVVLERKLKEVDNGDIWGLFEICEEMENDLMVMPGYKEYSQKKMKNEEGQEIIKFNTYPSTYLFNVEKVWDDWFSDNLPPEINLSGQFLLSTAIDAVAFILICLI